MPWMRIGSHQKVTCNLFFLFFVKAKGTLLLYNCISVHRNYTIYGHVYWLQKQLYL